MAEDMFSMGADIARILRAHGGEFDPLAVHDAGKRLYRMGYRKVDEPVLGTCAICRKGGVVLSQQRCLDCVNK